MKKIVVVCLLSHVVFSSSYERVAQLVGKYEGSSCSFEVRDLKKQSPLGYGINFPEWRYQLVFKRNGSVLKEAILSELPGYENDVAVKGDNITAYFVKSGDFFTTSYKFELKTDAYEVTSAKLFKKGFAGWRKQAKCLIK